MSENIIQEIKVGDKFGKWEVITAPHIPTGRSRSHCLCRCSCKEHTQRLIRTARLLNGESKSCGCAHKIQAEIGATYGAWKILEFTESVPGRGQMVKCQCQCKNKTVKELLLGEVVRGVTRSCGCSPIIRSGDKFGRWIVIREVDVRIRGSRAYECECSCDKHTRRVVSKSALTSKYTPSRSCGCLATEAAKARLTTHGRSYTKEYQVERTTRWYNEHPEARRRISSRRRALKFNASITWAKKKTDDVFNKLAKKAVELERRTGEKWHIDHIIPLQGKVGDKHVVCGLHVWYNLQLLPAELNQKKSCYEWPDMWC